MSEVHHNESPSRYNAWAYCIGWSPVDRQNEESNAGTHNHEELHKGLIDSEYEPDTFVSRWAKDAIAELAGDISPSSELRLVGTMPGVEGVYGTADVLWQDVEGFLHIADLKTFSDGTEDYSNQLMGYASLWYDRARCEEIPDDLTVYLHVLHGGICKVETVETTLYKCYRNTIELLKKVREDNGERSICKYCQYCSHIKECPMTNQAVQVVNGNGVVDFSKMSLPQKLVICDAVEKLCKTLKDEAKQLAIDNGGFIEADGIRYEIKERAGKGKVRDLCEVASAVPCALGKDGVMRQLNGLTSDELLALCELPKTAFTNAMKERNANLKDVPKKNIEAWCASFFDKGELSQYLSRVK